MTDQARFFVVCGLHRSGTTFAGRIVGAARRLPVLDEPLNIREGVADVPIVYPFVAAGGGRYAGVVDDVVAFRRPWTRDLRYRRRNPLKRSIFRATGGYAGVRWGLLRIRIRLGTVSPPFLWKDPFATLAMPYLLARYGVRGVCMVRHPAAVHCSTARQGWRFDADNLQRQEELIQAYGCDILPAHWRLAREQPAVAIALLWKMMVRIHCELAERDERLLLIRHEDLCRDPQKTADRVVSHFGLEQTPVVRKFVSERSFGARAEPADGKVHDMFRDSEALADAWRAKIPASEEAMMREVVGDDILRVYESW